jgi:hypothetical protein
VWPGMAGCESSNRGILMVTGRGRTGLISGTLSSRLVEGLSRDCGGLSRYVIKARWTRAGNGKADKFPVFMRERLLSLNTACRIGRMVLSHSSKIETVTALKIPQQNNIDVPWNARFLKATITLTSKASPGTSR